MACGPVAGGGPKAVDGAGPAVVVAGAGLRHTWGANDPRITAVGNGPGQRRPTGGEKGRSSLHGGGVDTRAAGRGQAARGIRVPEAVVDDSRVAEADQTAGVGARTADRARSIGGVDRAAIPAGETTGTIGSDHRPDRIGIRHRPAVLTDEATDVEATRNGTARV